MDYRIRFETDEHCVRNVIILETALQNDIQRVLRLEEPPVVLSRSKFEQWLSESQFEEKTVVRLGQALRETMTGQSKSASKSGPRSKFRILFGGDEPSVKYVIVPELALRLAIKDELPLATPSLMDIFTFQKWLAQSKLRTRHDSDFERLEQACNATISGRLKTVSKAQALEMVAKNPLYWSYMVPEIVGVQVGARIEKNRFTVGAPPDYMELVQWCVFSNGTGMVTLRKGKEKIVIDFKLSKLAAFSDSDYVIWIQKQTEGDEVRDM